LIEAKDAERQAIAAWRALAERDVQYKAGRAGVLADEETAVLQDHRDGLRRICETQRLIRHFPLVVAAKINKSSK